MFMTHGIGVDALVKVAENCRVSGESVGDEVQFRFGGERSTGLSLVLTAVVLEKLMAVGGELLAAIRADREPDAGHR